jgi:hypothetical protein
LSNRFQIGSASAAPGERAFGVVDVALRTDGSPISIPILLVHGAQPGPTLCLSAGMHADEIAGIEAATRLGRELDPAELSGTLVSVPIVNHPSFDSATRTGYIDHINLNRAFPGAASGPITAVIAHVFLNEVVKKCDALVDLHGSGSGQINEVVIAQGGYEDLVWDMALATGFDLVWLGGPWGGTGRISALQSGIPAITVEAGGKQELIEADVQIHMQAVKSVMRHLGILAGEPELAETYRTMAGGSIYGERGGFFHPMSEPGEMVAADQIVGIINDLHGHRVEEIRSPIAGVVCEMRVIPAVRPGDELIIIGEILETRENEHAQ